MEKLVITGGQKLNGSLQISGAKNAALPLMCASLLTAEPLTLCNLPRLADISTLSDLLNHMGVGFAVAGGASGARMGRRKTLDGSDIVTTTAPYDMVRKMRASIIVLGPLVARFGHARVSLPGGCAIGNRPIDLHLKALEAIGATIDLNEGYVEATAKDGLTGGHYVFPFASVGATENAMMAATLAKGTSILENVAREPEIIDLAKCLNAMGAKISGAGTSTLTIQGVDHLKGTTHDVMPDRVEAISYAVAAMITGGEILLEGAKVEDMASALKALTEAGGEISTEEAGVRVIGPDVIKPINLVTMPYPGFPTDMQAQLMAMLTLADGTSIIEETIFENRYMHVPELIRMGADITIKGNSATIKGVSTLKAAPVMATDLRASMSLAIAALAAEGTSEINRLYHLDRGYERMEEKLQAVGAQIERVPA
ncbi:UDP-N-acetylglucosamine 1-carboxyvinyltransferase [Temperatibacter marinus]|uniref:UDP-N-acetylglucosamine 1-carboxyvinyltransferase n=1 Tax=Temperatibacter marinus TaxID=1456591 RepID=A0AA52EEJ3_9PROT|nr:UDP-N-acetylglucosamine 1-carboxyvinyltransferase [Temperatibacter marinus]WND04037.1 UDP-N-acetylglucosamine 1-carboxyvinyltransferase [Temperatibacter marinus]